MDKTALHPFVSAFVDSTMQSMQEIVRSGEEVCPQVYLLAWEKDDPAILPLLGIADFFVSKERKRLLRSVIKQSWTKISSDKPSLKLLAVLMLSEVWVKSITIEQFQRMGTRGRDAPFSPKPGMAEALVIQISLADKEILYQWPYVRGGGEIVFAPEPTMEQYPVGPRALLMGLWPL